MTGTAPESTNLRTPPLGALIAGFACIYIVWGSTYLGIRFAVETLPPFLMAGTRFIIAGGVLWLIMIARRAPRPTFAQFRGAAIIGAIMLAGGNGLVSWAEQWVPSGVAALIVGTVPLWMVLFDWWIGSGKRPNGLVIGGLVVGFTGVGILAIESGGIPAAEHRGSLLIPIVALLLACVFWAFGSLRSKRVDQGSSLLVASAMQMIGGGVAMTIIGTSVGEWTAVDPASISLRSLLSYLYLIFIGSLVGYSTYVWLLRVASPTAVSTYAYVNPIVAVVLGSTIGAEHITPGTLGAGAMIVGAVALMTFRRRKPLPAGQGSAVPSDGSTAILDPEQCENESWPADGKATSPLPCSGSSARQ